MKDNYRPIEEDIIRARRITVGLDTVSFNQKVFLNKFWCNNSLNFKSTSYIRHDYWNSTNSLKSIFYF